MSEQKSTPQLTTLSGTALFDAWLARANTGDALRDSMIKNGGRMDPQVSEAAYQAHQALKDILLGLLTEDQLEEAMDQAIDLGKDEDDRPVSTLVYDLVDTLSDIDSNEDGLIHNTQIFSIPFIGKRGQILADMARPELLQAFRDHQWVGNPANIQLYGAMSVASAGSLILDPLAVGSLVVDAHKHHSQLGCPANDLPWLGSEFDTWQIDAEENIVGVVVGTYTETMKDDEDEELPEGGILSPEEAQKMGWSETMTQLIKEGVIRTRFDVPTTLRNGAVMATAWHMLSALRTERALEMDRKQPEITEIGIFLDTRNPDGPHNPDELIQVAARFEDNSVNHQGLLPGRMIAQLHELIQVLWKEFGVEAVIGAGHTMAHWLAHDGPYKFESPTEEEDEDQHLEIVSTPTPRRTLH